MKKFLKIKIGDKLVLKKSQFYSKKKRDEINELLQDEKFKLNVFLLHFSIILKHNKKSITIKFIEFKKLKKIITDIINDEYTIVHAQTNTNHVINFHELRIKGIVDDGVNPLFLSMEVNIGDIHRRMVESVFDNAQTMDKETLNTIMERTKGKKVKVKKSRGGEVKSMDIELSFDRTKSLVERMETKIRLGVFDKRPALSTYFNEEINDNFVPLVGKKINKQKN